MLKSYFTLAWRSLHKRKGATIINVVGLTAGLAACLLIGLWVHHHLSYDDFHPDAERIYRVAAEVQIASDRAVRRATTPAPLRSVLAHDLPEVEAVTQFRYQRSAVLQHQERALADRRVVRADSSFLNVFGGFRMLHGTRRAALNDRDAIVLTASTAEQLFGRTDVIGETLITGEAIWRVTGVLADVPAASHFRFDALQALGPPSDVFRDNWTGWSYYTYAKLAEGAAPEAFETSLQRVVETYALADVANRGFDMSPGAFQYRLFPQPLPRLHLHSDLVAGFDGGVSITTVYVFSVIGFFTLLIACINFMNLATAQASERATEVGVRKALGAGREQLAAQFLGEAVLVTILSALCALGIVWLSLPAFNAVAGTSIRFESLLQPSTLLVGAGVVLLVGLLAGSYPAFALSRFAPATVLKGSNRHGSGGQGHWLRQGLVVFQFSVSIVLITATLVARAQFDHVQSKQLGLDREHVVGIEKAGELGVRRAAFVERVRQVPGVRAAGASDDLFGDLMGTAFYDDRPENNVSLRVNYLQVGHGFVEAMGIAVREGRTFDPARLSDSAAVLVNEAAVKAFGWDHPTQHQVFEGATAYNVIGVVEDFHYQSMRSRVEPLFLLLEDPVFSGGPANVYVRLAPGETPATLECVEQVWREMAQAPFQYTFLDQTYDAVHRDVQRAGQLFSLFAGLAVVLACLGLFGLTTYTVQQRTKEVGIRKVLGASAASIVSLLSKDFLALVLAGFAVAVPVAWWAMQHWLQGFAYRIDLGPLVFVAAGTTALLIAALTVGTQALRAAHADPADALRNE